MRSSPPPEPVFPPGTRHQRTITATLLPASKHGANSIRFMDCEQVQKEQGASHEPPTSNRAENIGVFEQRGSGESGADDTTPSPRRVEVEQRNELGPPPTRPTHHIKKDKSSQRENPCGPHQTIILPCIRANLSNGHKAPESLAATLHATATERESARFMGTIKGCLQNTLLSMILVAQASRLRVRAPSRCPFSELAARRRQNPQPRRLRHRFGNPKGIVAQNPGLPRSGYPGYTFNQYVQPQRVAVAAIPWLRLIGEAWPQPRCGWEIRGPRTQGRLADSPTLDFAPESLWDSGRKRHGSDLDGSVRDRCM